MKHKTLENVHITWLGYWGIGIWTLENGKKVLVKWWLPGSVVDGKILKQKKDYIELLITNVRSYDATLMQAEVTCPHYLFAYGHQQITPLHKQGCGWCKRQAITYAKQLELKQNMVVDSLRKVPACKAITLPPVLPSPLTFQYRNKIEFSCGTFRAYHDELGKSTEADGQYDEYTTIWFHQQGRFAQVVDIDQCFLVSPRMHEVYTLLKASMIASGLPMYRVKQHEGLFRHMVIRSGHHSQQTMVLLSIASRWFVDHEEDKQQREALLKSREEDTHLRSLLTTLVIIENNGLADTVHNPQVEVKTIRWEGRIFEELHIFDQVLHFQISPFSFFQTNTTGAEVLFTAALEMIGRVKGTVLDLYCGSGTIGICALKSGWWSRLVGIEIVEEAIVDAGKNAQINGVADQAHFFAGKAEYLVRHQPKLKELLEELELVIVDPPREGLHRTIVEFLLELHQSHKIKLLYISCNPVTFARDVQLLTEWGMILTALQPMDMFPQTYHVEMIGTLK
jgi:23S rRNA (uracil1939-C5)-methyltransferase